MGRDLTSTTFSRPKTAFQLAKEKVGGCASTEAINSVFRSLNQPEIGLVFVVQNETALQLATGFHAPAQLAFSYFRQKGECGVLVWFFTEATFSLGL